MPPSVEPGLVQLRAGPNERPIRPLPVLPVSERPLVDRQARTVRYLRMSLTDRCNYRCTYCMPEHDVEHGPRSQILTLEEVVRLCTVFARWGVDRVRLTGGEPTIRRGIVQLVATLAEIPTARGRLEVVMTTNGHLLTRLAGPLAAAGLRSLNVSVDSLSPERFAAITRGGDLYRVLAGIEAAREADLPVKINTVAMRGFNDDELIDLARWAWDRGCTPRFIEVMPMSGGHLYTSGELISAAEVRQRIAEGLGASLCNDAGEGVRGSGPAAYVRVEDGHYGGCRVGTIGAMTENFCSACNRLRVSATGQLHACLAHDDSGDLRAALRSEDPRALEAAARRILLGKRDGHGFCHDGSGGPRKAMVTIGG